MDYISHNPPRVLVLISGERAKRQGVVKVIAANSEELIAAEPLLLNSTSSASTRVETRL